MTDVDTGAGNPDTSTATTASRDTERRRWVIAGCVLVCGVLTLLPDVLHLDGFTPFAQAMAFRPLAVVPVIVAGVVLLVLTRVPLVGMVLLLVGVSTVPLVVTRTFGSVDPNGGGRELSVLVVNAQTAATDPGEVAGLVRKYQPDVVSLPEGDRVYRETVEADGDLNAYHGYSAQTDTSALSAVSVLVHERLGPVRANVDHTGRYPSWIISGGSLGGLKVVAYHASSPKQFDLSRWRADLDVLRAWCSGPDRYLVAGSFNATLDHRALREAMTGCNDTAASVGQGLTGTWPATLPRWAGSQLEHVIYNGDLTTHDLEFVDVPTSDHRAVLARYRFNI